MSEMNIQVEKRENIGSNASRRLRGEGIVPAVVYGGGRDSVAINVDRRKVLELLRSAAGENTIFLLNLGKTGKQRHAMIREMQVNPLTGEILHIDFQRILLTETLQVDVPIELVGIPEGVKTDGGLLDFMTREVSVECLPTDIPNQLEVDVTKLHIGDHVEAKDIPLPDKVTLITEGDRVIASVTHARVAEETGEEEGGLLEAAPQEPEVIGRESGEDEG
jgi:large subunit ribosomal protein L25